MDVDALAAAVEAHLVGASVRASRLGPLQRLARSASGGTRTSTELVVTSVDRIATFSLAIPDRDDLLVEPLAIAAATALEIAGRFGRAIAHLKTIAFDRSEKALAGRGGAAGLAKHNTSTVHLRATYVTEAGVAAEEARLGHAVIAMRRLVAHELWHLIEMAWETREYAATVAFRQEIGGWFGEETLERVVRSPGPARDQLIAEVSGYAATNPREATAEMFEQWWTRPVEFQSPAVQRFGVLVERYFPR